MNDSNFDNFLFWRNLKKNSGNRLDTFWKNLKGDTTHNWEVTFFRHENLQ